MQLVQKDEPYYLSNISYVAAVWSCLLSLSFVLWINGIASPVEFIHRNPYKSVDKKTNIERIDCLIVKKIHKRATKQNVIGNELKTLPWLWCKTMMQSFSSQSMSPKFIP